jgi:hypothetical protein
MVAPEYREEPCRTALNKVSGMSFRWSNPCPILLPEP